MATILVIDHSTHREMVVTLIRDKGHRPLEAADGPEALAMVTSEKPELIISDILMPTMDGSEFVQRLRADPTLAGTKVIFYAAQYREREARKLAEACGVSRVLLKPGEPGDIMDAIEQALARGPPRAAPEANERRLLHAVSDELSEKVAELRAANKRLTALNDINLKLASERNPRTLLNSLCRDARDLVGATYAVLRVRDGDNPQSAYFTTCGIDAATTAKLGHPRIDAGLFAQVMAERRPGRWSSNGTNPALGLPDGYPSVRSALASPIVSSNVAYGWICLLNKLGMSEFSDEDEEILTSLAAQVGRIYENDSLYAEVQRSAEQLRAEVVRHQRSADELTESEHRFRGLNADLERRVSERTAELEAANKELEAFDYSISHDLRAPLSRIQGFGAALLEDFGDKLGPEGRDFVQNIESAGRQMNQLVDDLLQLSTVTRTDLHRTHVDVSALARSVFDELHRAQPERDVELLLAPDVIARADGGLLRIVLENLVGNAWKFTSRRSGAQVEVGSRVARNGKQVLFVRDNGAGFDGVNARDLFAPFRRLHAQREFGGSGIGLATVRRIIRRHGGHIWARGAVDKGATFNFTLSP